MVTSPNCKSDLSKNVQRSSSNSKMPGKHKSSSKGGQGQQQTKQNRQSPSKQPVPVTPTAKSGKKGSGNSNNIPRRVSVPNHVTPVKQYAPRHQPTTPRKISTPRNKQEATTPNDNFAFRQQQQQPMPPMPQLSSSPSFAGSKCYEPPTPQSLPRPPTSWMMGSNSRQQEITSVRKMSGSKSSPFQDLVSSMLGREEERQGESRQQSNIQNVSDDDEQVSQHLKFLLKVQA